MSKYVGLLLIGLILLISLLAIEVIPKRNLGITDQQIIMSESDSITVEVKKIEMKIKKITRDNKISLSNFQIRELATNLYYQAQRDINTKITPELLLSICVVETRINNKAVGSLGERGMFQIHPVHWKDNKYLSDHICDTTVNMYLAIDVLSKNLKKYDNNVTMALNSYNGVSHSMSHTYAKKVLSVYNTII